MEFFLSGPARSVGDLALFLVVTELPVAHVNPRTLPRRSLYDWPTQINETVVFPLRVKETMDDAQRRIVNAANMKWQRRKLGWNIRTHRVGSGIEFMWVK
jgi:hypothetical protein